MYTWLARLVIDALERKDAKRILAMAAQDALGGGGVLPDTVPLRDALHVMESVWAAMSGFGMLVSSVEADGDSAAVYFQWGGIHDGELSLPGTDLPAIPATGSRVWVDDAIVLRFSGGRLASLRFASPEHGGIEGALAQIGQTIRSRV
jgi:hypothetical protein